MLSPSVEVAYNYLLENAALDNNISFVVVSALAWHQGNLGGRASKCTWAMELAQLKAGKGLRCSDFRRDNF